MIRHHKVGQLLIYNTQKTNVYTIILSISFSSKQQYFSILQYQLHGITHSNFRLSRLIDIRVGQGFSFSFLGNSDLNSISVIIGIVKMVLVTIVVIVLILYLIIFFQPLSLSPSSCISSSIQIVYSQYHQPQYYPHQPLLSPLWLKVAQTDLIYC